MRSDHFSRDSLLSLSGDALGCMPQLEVLDLSWNSGVGGALESLLGKLQPSLRELHLVDCLLSASDAAALGTLFESTPAFAMCFRA